VANIAAWGVPDDPLVKISRVVGFAALASEVYRVAPRIISVKGRRLPFPTETMVRILVLKRLHNLSDEQVEFQLLDRLSYQRFLRPDDGGKHSGSYDGMEL
jgi:hypothetical protein